MKKLFLLMLSLLFMFSIVSAAPVGDAINPNGNMTNPQDEITMRVSITNSEATFMPNVSDTIDYYIEIANRNPYAIDVYIDTDSTNVEFTTPTTWHIAANDAIHADYTITAVKSEVIIITAQFEGNGNTLSGEQHITIGLPRTNFDPKLVLYVGIPLVLILAAIIMYFVVKHYKRKPNDLEVPSSKKI